MEALLLGLSTGTGCLVFCGPVKLPYMLGEKRRKGEGEREGRGEGEKGRRGEGVKEGRREGGKEGKRESEKVKK